MARPIPFRVRLRRQTAIVSRWLHLYLSMVSFAVILFFAVTGLTLNHADWFAAQVRESRYKGTVPANLVKGTPDRGALVSELRKAHGIGGSVADFRADADQVSLSFKGPGYAADAFIDRKTGAYEAVQTKNGFVAILNDLHKGRDAGRGWSVLIDASAVLLTLVSVTGLVLLLFVYKRRSSGLILAAAGGVACWLVWLRYVP